MNTTNVELDLQKSASEDEYEFKASKEESVINGKFGDELLPVAYVTTFVWSLHSVTFWVKGSELRLQGLGFSLIRGEMHCYQENGQLYPTFVLSDTEILCYLSFKPDLPHIIKVKASGIEESISTELKIVEKPLIKGFKLTNSSSVELIGEHLNQDQDSRCVYTHNQVTTKTKL